MQADGYSTSCALPWSSAFRGRLPLWRYGGLHTLYVVGPSGSLIEVCLYQAPDGCWSFLLYDDAGVPLAVPRRSYVSLARVERGIALWLFRWYAVCDPAWVVPLSARPRSSGFAAAVGGYLFTRPLIAA